MLERIGSDFSDAMRKMNPPTHVATMKRGTTAAGRKGGRETHNAKKMYEEAQVKLQLLAERGMRSNSGRLSHLAQK